MIVRDEFELSSFNSYKTLDLCQSGWRFYSGMCYKLISNNKIDWNWGHKACMQAGPTTRGVRRASIVEFVQNHEANQWLVDLAGGKTFAISAMPDHSWGSGGSFAHWGYVNWADGQPNGRWTKINFGYIMVNQKNIYILLQSFI